VGVLVLLAAGAMVVLKLAGIELTQLSPERVRAFVLSFGIWAPAAYLLVYGQPFVVLPTTVLSISGGLAFGPAWGTAAALAGATLRACSQFAVARVLGRDVVAKLLHRRVARLNQQLDRHAVKAVALIRLIPNVPYDVQNFGFGVSQVRFAPYVLGSVLGIFPACVALAYLGDSITESGRLWKAGLAALLIVGLVFAGRAWKTRHRLRPELE
jgi:uncharacterized membrane protein YdjX (TVP38/TMEM64 family)